MPYLQPRNLTFRHIIRPPTCSTGAAIAGGHLYARRGAYVTTAPLSAAAPVSGAAAHYHTGAPQMLGHRADTGYRGNTQVTGHAAVSHRSRVRGELQVRDRSPQVTCRGQALRTTCIEGDPD